VAKAKPDDGSLKRLGGGRWETRDARFSIEPQSGTWVVVDAEQTDELGLPLVRGPFGSLNAAKEAIADVRQAGPAVSPQASRLAESPARPPRPAPAPPEAPRQAQAQANAKPARVRAPEKPREPRWFQGLEPAEKRRARELIGRLTRSGIPDPEGVARRDIVGHIPAVAALAVSRAINALGPEATPAEVARRLALGRDAVLDVRWRLVDGEGRPIGPESLA
jgi:hypothetical protein